MAVIQKQVRMVFDLNKCLGCHTCSIGCKTMWTDGRLDVPNVPNGTAPPLPPKTLEQMVGASGLPYQYWNNVETSPGRGYPKGVFTPTLGGGFDPATGKVKLTGALPSIGKDYGNAWEYNYNQVLKTAGGNATSTQLKPSPPPDGPNAYSSNWDEDVGVGPHPNGYFFYLPRICNHCTKPACVASCPKSAPYKREEDGIVLIDQTRCDGYRYCIQGCPYKKPYFNPAKKKSQKCIFCYPRLEQLPGSFNPPQPPRENFCFNQCVGRIRYAGYYNPNVANPATDVGNLSKNVNKLIDKWRVALRLHPEYGTEPNLYYVPPLSAPTLAPGANGLAVQPGTRRIPADYLATLFGDNALQTQAERVARINEVFTIIEQERAVVAAGGTSELIDILTARTEEDRLQLHLG